MQKLNEEELAVVENLNQTFIEDLAKFEDKHERLAGIHASEISKCYRQAVYTMRGEPKARKPKSISETAYWRLVLSHGQHIHNMLQEHFKHLESDELSFQEEVPIRPDLQEVAKKWNIHSSCDGVFTFYKKTWKRKKLFDLGVEIKSASQSNFSSTNAPSPDHIEQAHVYMAALEIPAVWFVYFNKNTQSHTPSKAPWIVEFDERIWARLEERFAMFHEHVNAGTIPDAMPGSQCKFCPYVLSCDPPAAPTHKINSPRFGKTRA